MRYLGRAKPKEQEFDFVTVDIETGKDKTYESALLGDPVYITWCIDGRGYGLESHDLTDWMIGNFLQSQYSGYILYAHNGFGFDYKRFDWNRLCEEGYDAEFLTGKDGSIKSVTFTKDDNVWFVRDSLLLIPRKLDDVTKTFAPEYRKLKREPGFDVKPFDPKDPSDTQYAVQDAVGLWWAIKRVDSILINRFGVSIHERATLPGIAFRAFRLMFEKGEKYPGIGWQVAHAAKESYHGGQTIAFKTYPVRDVISLDANSMYSHVMLSCGLPTGNIKHSIYLHHGANPDRTLCFAVVHIPHGVFPILKTKDAKQKVGNYNGVISGWYWLFELEKQKELGGSYEVVECFEWQETTDCATRFVELCRQLRMEDYFGALGEIAKLIANALYGKFAQSVAEWVIMMSKEIPEDGFPLYDPALQDVKRGLWQVPSSPSFNADMSHWASFITAKARMVLNNAIEKAGYENIIYCDTDSIFIERKYLHRVREIMGREYGQFKIEKGSEDKGIPFQAIAPKAYLFLDKGFTLKIKNKGIPTKDILKQDGFSRMGADNQEINFIQSYNLIQILKSGKGYGRRAHRRMATEQSTTNGKIVNGCWVPVSCELPPFDIIRGAEKNSTFIKGIYDRLIEEYGRKLTEGGEIEYGKRSS